MAKKKTPNPSYSELVKRLRPFYRIPAGKLTPQKKRFLTTKWKELNRRGATKFHAMPRERIEQFKAAGYTTTRKGVFVPQRPGEKFELRKTHAKFTKRTTGGTDRTEFEFPLSKSDTALFLSDPSIITDRIIAENPRLFKGRNLDRARWRLVFSKGSQQRELDVESLVEYIKLIQEPVTEDEEPDSIESRKKSLASSMAALRVVFATPAR